MKSLKPTLADFLRSRPITQQSQRFNVATRGIAGSTRNGSQIGIEPKSHQTTSFIPRDIRSTKIQLVSAANSFNTLLASLTTSLTTTPSPHLPHLTALLRSYISNSSEWSRYAHANPSKQYTRNLVHEVPGIFNLLLLVWTPGKMSPVHDHADAHCLMKVLKGSLVERRFAIPRFPGMEGKLKETVRKEYGLGKVSYMADQLGLHEISNPSPTEYAVSLHLYTPPNAAMRGCHVYDLENGEARHVMQGVYDSINGVPTACSK